MHVLNEITQAGRVLPPVLFLQLDNCARDNKNQLMFAFLGFLIYQKVFEEIHVNYLPVGHTHCEIDQHFSVISRTTQQQDMIEPKHLFHAMKDLFQSDGPIRRDVILDQVCMPPLSHTLSKMRSHALSL